MSCEEEREAGRREKQCKGPEAGQCWVFEKEQARLEPRERMSEMERILGACKGPRKDLDFLSECVRSRWRVASKALT